MSIIAIGEPLLEFSQVTDADGNVVYKSGYGGDTSNFAVAAARQGADVTYFTRLGDDGFGDTFLRLWQDEGVETRWIRQDPEAHTGIYFITHTDQGHEFTYFRAGSAASRMTPDEVPEEAVARARVLHVSGISQAISDDACDAVFRAIELAHQHGVDVSYDPNLRLKLWGLPRARAIINETVRHSRVFLPSSEDAAQLTGMDGPPQAIADYYLDIGAENVALKMGEEGVFVASPTERHWIRGISVQTVDTTGAGDTFDGAFIAELQRGTSLYGAAVYANAAAALSTTGYGAVGPIPTRSEVEALLSGRQDLCGPKRRANPITPDSGRD